MRRSLHKEIKAYSPIFAPLLLLALLLILTLTLGKFLFNQLNNTRANLASAKQKNELLTAKLDLLRGQSQADLQAKFDSARAAIPESEPTLFALSSLRRLAFEKNLTMANLRIQSAASTGIPDGRSVQLQFDIQGDLSSVLAFLHEVERLTPLMQISRVRTSAFGGVSSTNVGIIALWAPLPAIPAVDQPVGTLSQAEEELVKRLSELARPAQEVIALPPAQGRENPFAF